jgi:hypothetical protein
MRSLPVIFLLLLFACKSKPLSPEEKLRNAISGEWLVVYPSRDALSSGGREVYNEIKDSITSLQALRILRFAPDGSFYSSDSIAAKGKWTFFGGNEITVNAGGNGFAHFRADNLTYNETSEQMEMTERVTHKGNIVKVVWHLKKLTNKDTNAALFSPVNHRWRIKPTAPEPDDSIRERVAGTLSYYSQYYMTVAQHANYFLKSRIILPLAFYQHALGLKPLKADSEFAALFYDSTQASIGHYFLEQALKEIADTEAYPRDDSYVIGYANCMKLMAAILRRKN